MCIRDRPSPSLEMYCKVAKVIGIDFDDLIRMVNGKIVIGKSDSEPQTNKVSDNAMSIARAYDKATPEEQSEVNDILFRYIDVYKRQTQRRHLLSRLHSYGTSISPSPRSASCTKHRLGSAVSLPAL